MSTPKTKSAVKRERKPKVPEIISPRGSIYMYRVLNYGKELVTVGCFLCRSEMGVHDRCEFDALLYDRRNGDKKKRNGIEVVRWARKRPTRKPKDGAR